MKKSSLYLLGATLCFAFAACDTITGDGEGTGADGVAKVDATATASVAGMTKVNFDESTSGIALEWKRSGEKFSVIQGVDPTIPNTFTQTSGNKFAGKLNEGVADCYAVYPYVGTTQMRAGAVVLDLSRQLGTLDETRTFMWAKDVYDGSELDFQFQHLTSVVKVEMEFPATVNGVTVSDVTLVAGELSNKGALDLTAETPVVTPASSGNVALGKDFYMQGNVLSVYFNLFPGMIEDLTITAAVGTDMYNAELGDVTVPAAGKLAVVSAALKAGGAAPKGVWKVETVVGDGSTGSALGNGLSCQIGNGTGLAFVPGSNETKVWFTQRNGGFVRELTLNEEYTVTEVASCIHEAAGKDKEAIWQGAFNSKGEYFLAHKAGSSVYKYNAQEKKFELFADGINNPMNIAFDKDDNLYVPSRDAKKIIMITPDGVKSDYASTGAYKPNYITFDSKGNLLCGTNGNWVIFQVSPDKTVKPIIGSGVRPKDSGQSTIVNGEPGNPLAACVGNSQGITVGSDGCVYFTDQTDEYCVRKLTPGKDGKYETGTVTTIAGARSGGTEDGFGEEARFKTPDELIITSDCKTIYVICSTGNVIKKLTYME